MSLPTCLVYSLGIKHQGLNLWGCPCQHVFSLLLKLLRVGIITACSGSSWPNGFLCKESKFSFYFRQYVFPFVPSKMWAVKIQKQSVLKNENTNYFDHIHIVPYMSLNRNVYPLIPYFYMVKLGYTGVYIFSYF